MILLIDGADIATIYIHRLSNIDLDNSNRNGGDLCLMQHYASCRRNLRQMRMVEFQGNGGHCGEVHAWEARATAIQPEATPYWTRVPCFTCKAHTRIYAPSNLRKLALAKGSIANATWQLAILEANKN
jgi:hypothetical protein